MKAIVPFLLCAWAGVAAAQTPAPEPAPVAAPSVANVVYPPGDPRTCLEFPTRQKIITCAEKYLPRRPAAKS